MQNCGHTPYVEDPKRFVCNILDFLDNRRILVLTIKKIMRIHKIKLQDKSNDL